MPEKTYLVKSTLARKKSGRLYLGRIRALEAEDTDIVDKDGDAIFPPDGSTGGGVIVSVATPVNPRVGMLWLDISNPALRKLKILEDSIWKELFLFDLSGDAILDGGVWA